VLGGGGGGGGGGGYAPRIVPLVGGGAPALAALAAAAAASSSTAAGRAHGGVPGVGPGLYGYGSVGGGAAAAALCAEIFDAISEDDAAATADARAAPPKPAKVAGFFLGAGRKGYVYCAACHRELWAPNCKRHVCAQRQGGVGGGGGGRGDGRLTPVWPAPTQ